MTLDKSKNFDARFSFIGISTRKKNLYLFLMLILITFPRYPTLLVPLFIQASQGFNA